MVAASVADLVNIIEQCRQFGGRQVLVQNIRDWRNPAQWNDISRKLLPNDRITDDLRGSGIVDRDQISRTILPLTEIAAPQRFRRDGCKSRRTAGTLDGFLVGDEEERLIPSVINLRHKHRAPNGATKIVLAHNGASGREKAARIQFIVPEVFEQRTVQIIGTGLCREVDNTVRGPAELRRITVANDLEFAMASVRTA